MGAHRSVNKETIFFDGVCNLCNGAVNFIIDRDPDKRFQFASLQSSVARDILPEQSTKLESIVLIKPSGEVYRKSSAALEITRKLNGAWFLFYGFKIIPRVIRDWIYDLIANNRYNWFGKRDTCRIPTPELQERFLEA